MKRKILLGILSLVCIGATVGFIGCGEINSGDKESSVVGCAHEWASIVLKEATCTEKGLVTDVCALCGDDFSKIIPALGHSYTNYVDDKNTTCTRDGTETAYCDNGCGGTNNHTLPAFGHSYTNYVVKEATCTQDGSKTAYCDNGCGTRDVIENGKAFGHSYTNYVDDKNTTCTRDGTETAYCDNGCGRTDKHIVTAFGHDYVDHDGKAATCTEGGWEAYQTCNRCTYNNYTELSALGHKYVNLICERCDEKYISKGLKFTLNSWGGFYSVTGIGTCTDKDIVIPAEYNGLPVTSIGYNAFYNCSSLTSVVIPDSVTSIGDYAFYNCTSLTDITVDAKNEYYQSIDSNLYTKDGKTLIQYAIGKTQTEFIIPDSVTSIGDSAFMFCRSLSSVVIPDSVTSIVDWAFSYCKSLSSVVIGDGVTSIGYQAFYNCDSLSSVVIPDSVTTIGASAFSNCSNLSFVVIPDSVTTIGSYAFENCSSLSSVVIPDSVTTIGYDAFSSCSKLKNVYYTGSETEWQAIIINSGNSSLTNATKHYNYIPEN